MTYLFSSNVEVSNDQGNALPISVINTNGAIVSNVNPLPVTIGSDTINIIGNITIPTVVQVYSNVGQPIHNHITEVGTTDLLAANIGYMPIGGNVEISNDVGNPIPISANTSVNSANNPIYIAGAVTTAGGSAQGKLWFFQIAQGLIAGHIPVFKSGYNPSITNNTEESLWTRSVIYPWSSWGAGGTLSCVSTSASDTGTLTIVGLRSSDWVQITETITLTGTSPKVTTNSFIRINNIYYSNGETANVGEIDMSRNGTVVGTIGVGFGAGQMAQYTVPAGYTAYLLNGRANLGKGNDGIGYFSYRIFGNSFQKAMTFLLFQSTFEYEFQAPLVLPEKTDLDVSLTASVSGTAATCAYSLILIAN
jgi:hypothetical protein